ncbi:hypothetical protein L195_g011673 [Trifolium pratense]|uniref:Cysteine desulfurase mitochondrial-like n=1 Tax=Trifolium pratense TaxID=57577 RepID=A0A2K3PI65_TRIPR|nr:hypothetical protein L195_g011673 [Trifolium pratense]
MANINLENLSLQTEDEEEGFVFDLTDEGEEQVDFRWCLVGRFIGDRPIHANSMKVTMADLWRPVRGVKIKEASKGLFLFQFSHELDMEDVLQGGPWSFDNQMLIVQRVQLGVQIENMPLYHVEFWVQVHNLPVGLMVEKVGKALANYIGSFVEYDKNNNSSFWRQYMRLRVRIDVRQPLKKNKQVKNSGGDWCTVNFKYEKLGVFCFVCGILGHTENKCEIRFAMESDDGVRGWSNELRTEPRRRSGRPTSRWLKDEGGSNGVQDGRRNPAAEFGTGEYAVDPTSTNNQPNHSNNNLHFSLSVAATPPSNDRQSPTAAVTLHPLLQTNIQDPQSSIRPAAQLLPTNCNYQPSSQNVTNSLTINPIVQPSLSNNNLPHNTSPANNTSSRQLLANNTLAATSLNLSPLITDAINHNPTFSFQSSPMAHLSQINKPMNRTIKSSLTLKLNPPTSPNPNRTAPKNTPTEPKKNPDGPNPTLIQNPTEAMETQTEKKRRREENNKEIEGNFGTIQHFLSAGPGSQACREQ